MGLFGSIIGSVTSIIGGNAQKKAASKAADAQVKAAQLAIDEQRRQFDTTQNNFAPYLGAGTSALGQISSLLGISSPGTTDWAAYVGENPDALANWNAIKNTSDGQQFGGDISAFGKYHYQADGSHRDLSPYTTGATDGAAGQQAAIDALKESPLYQSLYRNGKEALLSAGAATGGLRGGNMQGALANFGADTLSQVIQNQLANLGGIANMGQGSAGQLGSFGANMANQVGAQMNNQGMARSNASMLNGALTANQWKSAGDGLDSVLSSIFGGGGIKL